MFITVSRHGGGRPLRLALGAIAWLDEADAGAVIRLTSGDGLHVAETVAEIEAAIAPLTMRALPVDVTEEQSEELRQISGDAATSPAAPATTSGNRRQRGRS
ncbi:hypothetical protein BRX43_15860 [Sphingomonas sp. S-NIH.Pt15_0812]|nr:hypothetical protein BRX43_15860 [Sphingomonas sp. S-NIH.Pt15_0812]